MIDLKKLIHNIFFVLLVGAVLPSIAFYALYLLNHDLHPSIYLSSGFSSIIAVVMTIIITEQVEGEGIKEFLKYFIILIIFLLLVAFALHLIAKIPVVDIKGIFFGAFFGVCVGFAIKFTLPKE